MFRIEIHTDGSAFNKQGGWCAIVIAREEAVTDEELVDEIYLAYTANKIGAESISGDGFKIMVLTGKEDDTTNNRMELRPIIEAIKKIQPCTLTVLTDSTYAIGVLSGKFKKIEKNLDMIAEFKKESRGFRIRWKHVKGHDGNVMNEVADNLASYRR